jgi:tyrosyl-tRNA synthetase
VGTEGREKMSKSLGNYIGINEPPGEIYGKAMSISDELIYPYFQLATDVSLAELREIKGKLDKGSAHPMALKRQLARRLVSMYYGMEEAQRAEEAFDAVFRAKEVPEEISEYHLPSGQETIWIVRLLTVSGMATSGNEARRLIQQGAVSMDGHRLDDVEAEISPCGGEVLKVGKRKFVRIRKTT